MPPRAATLLPGRGVSRARVAMTQSPARRRCRAPPELSPVSVPFLSVLLGLKPLRPPTGAGRACPTPLTHSCMHCPEKGRGWDPKVSKSRGGADGAVHEPVPCSLGGDKAPSQPLDCPVLCPPSALLEAQHVRALSHSSVSWLGRVFHLPSSWGGPGTWTVIPEPLLA